VNAIVLFEIAYLLSVRRLRSPGWQGLLSAEARPAWVSIALVLTAQAAFTYLPQMNALFTTEPLRLDTWLLLLPGALVVFLVSEWEKTLIARRTTRKKHPGEAQGTA
jgi:magnesium-transporting ATPase (P-type)